jgi:hypothetical protein
VEQESRRCATCGAPWRGVERGPLGSSASWYVSELAKLRAERDGGAPVDFPIGAARVTPREDLEVLRRLGLTAAEVAVARLGSSPLGRRSGPSFGAVLMALGAATDPAGGLLARAVRDRTYQPIRWVDVPGPDGIILTVGADLLRATVDGQSLRLPVSWEETQAIARTLSAELGEDVIAPSKRIADAVYAAAPVKTVYHSPVYRTPDGRTLGISTIGDVARFNADIDRQVAAQGGDATGLVSGAEKLWVLDARLDPAVNAEFLSRTGSLAKLIDRRGLPAPGELRAMNYGAWGKDGRPQQPVSGAHPPTHWDVSQLYRPLKRWARDAQGARVDLLAWIERHERVDPRYTAPFKATGA